MRMSRGLAIGLVSAIAVGWMAGGRVSAPVSAQAQPVPEGAYRVATHERGKRTVTPQMDVLHILPGNRYAWENDHANYRATGSGPQFDCRADWLASYSSARREMLFEFDDNGTTNKLTLTLLGPVSANPRQGALKPWRDCKYVTAGPTRPSLVAGLVAQASPPRPVTGELLLTTEDPGTAEDLALWRCLTDAYPRLEFAPQAGGEPERVFVFPDGRFRADLQGGSAYAWTVVTAGCRTVARQPSGDPLRPGPAVTPAAGEKILLACYVSGGVIRNCRSWWLTRP